MLQQTRVSAVLPFYQRFVARFPTVAQLASASEQEVLRYWAGLGYYSRARNLHAAAKQIAADPKFPDNYDDIRSLPGVGDYTASAIASIAFNVPHPVLDGNVARVLARITAEPGDIRNGSVRARLRVTAATLLDKRRPGDFNQALMELGATVCLPQTPDCARCPVARCCVARATGKERELPVLSPKPAFTNTEITLLIVRRSGRLLLRQRSAATPRMAGFWELPEAEALPAAKILQEIAVFRHTIVSTRYRCRVALGDHGRRPVPEGFIWLRPDELNAVPLSSTARKALACYESHAGKSR